MRILYLHHILGTAHGGAGVQDAKISEYASPGTTIDTGYPDNFPGSHLWESGETKMVVRQLRIPALVQKIVWAEQAGYDAVIQSNTYDPGVEAARFAVGIPVIGVLRTALHVGLNLADRIGIMIAGSTPLEDLERHVWDIARSYSLDHVVSGIRHLSGAYDATVLGDKEAVFNIAVTQIRELVHDTGAEIVLPLGGAIIPNLVDPHDLELATGVQILNTKAIAVQYAEMCVRLGMTHSSITYPRVHLSPEDLQ